MRIFGSHADIGCLLCLASLVNFTAGCAHTMANGTVPSTAYGALETGVVRRTNGLVEVRVLTQMHDVKPEMVAWWFEDYLQTTEHYKRWHPTAHIWMAWEDKVPGQLIGAKHLVRETIGTDVQELRIQFVEPPPGLQAGSWAACARVGPLDQDLFVGSMCHVVRPVPWGAEMRSYFVLGDIQRREGDDGVRSVFAGFANTAVARQVAVRKQLGIDLMAHCVEEMSILASFLPELYAEQAEQSAP